MRDDDVFLIKLSEEEIRAMPVEEKLNVLLKVTLPILSVLYGNGKEGLKQKVEKHSTQLKYVWLILTTLMGISVAIAWRK